MHKTKQSSLKYDNILVLVDLNYSPDNLIAYTRDLSTIWDGQYWLLHVAPPDPEFVGYEVGPRTVRDQVAHELRDEHRKLQSYADSLRSSGVNASALLVKGQTTDKVLDEISKLSIDLIVSGLRHHGALQKLLSGSVAAKLIELSPCPVLLIPTQVSEFKIRK